MVHTPCPCCSGAPYAACCGRWHAGATRLLAPDPVALLRSRYSAYALGLTDYLLDTWAAETRPPALDAPSPGLRWLGLEVRQVAADAHQATVEFVVRTKFAGRAQRHHETSRFERRGGRWVYVGEVAR